MLAEISPLIYCIIKYFYTFVLFYAGCTQSCVFMPTVNAFSGVTYCQSAETNVELNSGSDTSIIFVDHVTFGRPFYMEKSLTSDKHCSREMYAKSNDDYCVASNALSAVIYWCQGKKRCSFTTDMLIEAPMMAKDFYVANLGAKMTYSEAAAACNSAGHTLATLRCLSYLSQVIRINQAILLQSKVIRSGSDPCKKN